ncbi:hypothetical protein NQ314_005428 [Rhamnusium bicolor]|uniref:Elongation factor 1-gamma n=1 Tax=Rhamnusium bicolor TaxID=1586634 RepID=A0AAV8ZJG1_9CUCU|nr:hypothetical protein NQ314_005428 [Rhamnusium bicolor]
MAAGTLYSYPDNFRAAKALIAAQYAKANVKIAANFVFGETNKSKEFLTKFPGGKVPAFETNDGKYLQDSNAIAYFVSNDQLRGKNEYDRAQILQWIGFAKNNAGAQEAFQRAKDDMKVALTVLNSHLLTHTYLVGDRITLADIAVACNLLNPYKYVLDPEYRKPFGNVNRWFNTLINQPEFKAVLGTVELCSKAAQAGAIKEEGMATNCINDIGDMGNNNLEKNKKKKMAEFDQISETYNLIILRVRKKRRRNRKRNNNQKKEAPKKEEEPTEELDAADEICAAEPKSKDPFDSMPKGEKVVNLTINYLFSEPLTWMISNVATPTKMRANRFHTFWENFDPTNYSIWYCEYKYPQELSKVFMSCNLITGMFQRLDKMRKHAFSSVCLFGEDDNSTISGIWVWRGQELAFPLSPDWQIDYESYDWTKLDANSEETKKLVEQYFSWSGTDKGDRKFNQGKIFK